MIDLKRFFRLYPSGLCKVEKVEGDSFNVSFKRFDNETGEEINPEPNYVSLEDLKKWEAELVTQLSALHIIQENINKL